MDQGALVKEEIDAGAELVREFDKYEPVKAAFWLKASDEPHRSLYIASDQINDANLDVAYGEVLRLTDRVGSSDLDRFRVKLIGPDNPLAIAAMEMTRNWSAGRRSLAFGGNTFGGVSVDSAYVYAPLSPAATP